MFLINFSNQIAAGPKNISINFIKLAITTEQNFIFILPDLPEYRVFTSTANVKFKFVGFRYGVFGAIFKAFHINYYLIPKLLKTYPNVQAVLAFGNFLTVKSMIRKVVLLHHPYIVDDSLFNSLPFLMKIIEFIKRLQFRRTSKNVDVIIAQSDYMRTSCEDKYPFSKGKVIVIPNPISSNFKLNKIIHEQGITSDFFNILYVSRYYPHKNHQFVLEVAERLESIGIKARFIVTVAPSIPGASLFLEKQSNMKNILNLGEVTQDELIEHYKNSSLFFFPSKAETFGNPIIEAMYYAKPLLLPNLDYAKSIADGVAMFYESNNVDDCVNKILNLVSDTKLLTTLSLLSEKRSKSFLYSEKWFSEIMKQLVKK